MPFDKIAPYLEEPLVLIGFVLFVFLGLARAIVGAGIVPKLTRRDGYRFMMRLLTYGFILALFIVFVGSGIKYKEISEEEQRPAKLQKDIERVCVSFETYQDNTEFNDNENINDFIFQSLHRTGRLFVNKAGEIQVLQFMNEGLRVELPNAARMVEIKVADFYLPVNFDALGENNLILESKTIDRDNSTEWFKVRRNSFSIYKIELRGGGNEGGVERVCAEIEK